MGNFVSCPWCDSRYDDDTTSHDCGLSDDVVRRLIARCVTVVGEDEVLVVRMPLTVSQERYEAMEEMTQAAYDSFGVRVMFVGGEEFAVVTAPAQMPVLDDNAESVQAMAEDIRSRFAGG